MAITKFEIEKNIPLPANDVVDPVTGLNAREEKFVDIVLNSEKGTMGKRVQDMLHEEGLTSSPSTARVTAANLRKKPAVMATLEKHAEAAEQGIVEIAKYATTLGKTGGKEGAAYASVGLSAHDKILDRVYGKAKQSIDITSRSVTINMDLTQSLPDEEEDDA